MSKKIQQITFVVIIGFFFILDKIFKNFFLNNPQTEKVLIKKFLSLKFFENPGIAFGIKSPLNITIILSLFILVILFFYFIKYKKYKNDYYFRAFLLIFLGALSNLLDRLFLNFTVDYLHIYISVINIADIMIVLGAILFFLEETGIRKKIKNVV